MATQRPTEATDALKQQAVTEIKETLANLGGYGRVWIDNWNVRYGPLGPLREFMEQFPGELQVIPGQHRSYTVSLLTIPAASPRGKGKLWGSVKGGWNQQPAMLALPGYGAVQQGGNSRLIGGAITEIKNKLRELGGQGRIWIDNWHGRFGQLGSLKEFIESRPDKFTLIPGNGPKQFSIALAGTYSGPILPFSGKRKASEPQGQNQGWKRVKTEAQTSDGAEETEDTYEKALEEIKNQLKEQGGSGKVWIRAWNSRFGSYGTLREFLEAHPEHFTIVPGEGKVFSVELVE